MGELAAAAADGWMDAGGVRLLLTQRRPRKGSVRDRNVEGAIGETEMRFVDAWGGAAHSGEPRPP